MSHFLLHKELESGQADLLEGVRMVYTLNKHNLEISFRQDVQTIKVGYSEYPPRSWSNPYRLPWVRSSCHETMTLSSTRSTGLGLQP